MQTQAVTHDTCIRVRYADTDQMQIVYNGKYFEYFEVGRTELMRSRGFPYAAFERSGTRLPLVEAHCRFHHPARYDDLLLLRSTVTELPRATLRIDYEIHHKDDGLLIATGYTTHAFLDTATLRPVRPPRLFLDALWPHR
ncbi:MAG: acyl-CoA thioesterase [Bacteroidetes bacterium]|nr:acyl-CoA thioesterase [Bacteroidota bacterium]